MCVNEDNTELCQQHIKDNTVIIKINFIFTEDTIASVYPHNVSGPFRYTLSHHRRVDVA